MTTHSPTRVAVITILCFVIFFILLVFSISDVVNHINFEAGDFAANSTLIQQAKNGWLLTGNYSRVGFNHPGPAILYVLAAGEFFLFDKLHLVPSAFSGQLVAVAAYNAFWVAVLFRMLFIQQQRIDHAVLALLTIVAGIALADHQIFNGIWFPHLYVMPFCVMLMALTVTLTGNIRFLLTLSLATGFLVNGHVSFIPFLFVLFVLGYVVTFCLQGVGIGSLSQQLIARENNYKVIFSFLLVVFFFTPVIILTITDFPGPFYDYMKFGGGHSANTALDSLRYISVYWGGFYAQFVSGVFFLVLFCTSYDKNKLNNVYYGSIVIVLVTICLFLYVKYGVDMLDEVYIGEYYYAVPAFLACLCILAFIHSSRERAFFVVGLFFSAICAVIIVVQVLKPTTYQSIYNDRVGLEIYQKLEVVRSDSRIVLDLSVDQHWGYLWSAILGAEVVAARKGENLFCLNKGWHISFTKQAKCSAEEVKNNDRYLVKYLKSAEADTSPGSFSTQLLQFKKSERPEIVGHGMIEVSKEPDIFGQYLLNSGWSSLESQFVWSVGPEAVILLPVGKGFTGAATLDVAAFLPIPGTHQNIQISHGDAPTIRHELTTDNPRQLVTFPIKNADRDVIDIRIAITTPKSPKELGLSDDPREIGIALYGIEVEAEP